MTAADIRPHEFLLSIVTPAYNEERNLPEFHDQLQTALDRHGIKWEWVIVDDHSTDGTFAAGAALADVDPRVRIYRLARNSGSHIAARCGMTHARGDCSVMISVDLQDPPETIVDLLTKWRNGADLVWAVRSERQGESAATLAFSRFYYWFIRYGLGFRDLPPTGSDFFAADRRVVDAYLNFRERHANMFLILSWIGFRQDTVPYTKQARLHGSTGWTLARKVKLFIDSISAFSYRPIRFMSAVGVVTFLIGAIYAAVITFNALVGTPAPGWSSLMVVVLMVGGIQMLMMGMLGEYLWRTLDESRRRPLYAIERWHGSEAAPPGDVRDGAPTTAAAKRDPF